MTLVEDESCTGRYTDLFYEPDFCLCAYPSRAKVWNALKYKVRWRPW